MILPLVAVALWALFLNHIGSAAHLFEHGLPWLMTSRDEAERPEPSVLESRFARAQRNLIENLIVFFPLAILAMVQGHDSGLAVTLCWVFLGARIGHVLFYAGGIPPLRSLTHLGTLSVHLGMVAILLGVVS